MWTINRFPGLWLLPALLPVILMTVYPIGHALWTSLHEVMILFPGEPFVGLRNYGRVVASNYFQDALRNSLVFTLFAAPSAVILGTLIALFLQRRFFGSQVVRSIVLLPWVLPGAISAVLWVWVFHPSFGILNGIMRDLGLIEDSILWLTNPRTALMAVTFAHVWTQIPFAVVLMMAALSTINSETLEAAAIDCRNPLKRFRYIIFPEIKAMIVVLLVYNALIAFTSYDLVYAMTGGGPGTATTLLSFQIWRESFSMYDFGAGSAVAFIVVVISAVLIVAITRALPSDLFASD
ncbi:sugar ABC transporter permease [Sinorhizobium numidicum]|uniref:Sugar ABC transporter permease n=1 Tax=Sinorhizobium numidicum TaxID=680248 RepID=A0ABY8CPW9_9HYPH|nr:sugar ABC transporter permease [Sinorhizobium numidicum]WEX74714.1 sugar ABC transporter permease [Sinorhizobium numidicum]WEX80706.1 sugar ABC transporter permease [Sinorhizobium numidicum]